jgi:hypothetical protein
VHQAAGFKEIQLHRQENLPNSIVTAKRP